ncbi:hypothetical protein [Coprobacter tertius]|uniref:Gram-negative bacterial tonB protein n=1 Tax=Coprobacter tertius TaxID=2944915 RepID=A0ABT1MFJ8_9BACT|nr:hypothetical protein [Coprobacter tertius]MCP9610824.1 hypothetical protein [Coprobacter tertius]
MIFKCLLIGIILLFPVFRSHSQNKTDSIENSIMYDVVEGFPVIKSEEIQDTVYFKYFIPPSWQDVCINLFKGGYEAFTAYCDSIYYNRDDYNYDELNASAIFVILFDENLEIKDVRILKRIAYNNNKYDYDALVKRILWSTEGKWVKKDENDHCKWYFHLGYFKLR